MLLASTLTTFRIYIRLLLGMKLTVHTDQTTSAEIVCSKIRSITRTGPSHTQLAAPGITGGLFHVELTALGYFIPQKHVQINN